MKERTPVFAQFASNRVKKTIQREASPTFRDVVRLAILGTLGQIRALGECVVRPSASADFIEAALAQRGGDVPRALRILARIHASANARDAADILEYYVPILISSGEIGAAEHLILQATPKDAGARAGLAALAAVAAAIRGEFEVSKAASARASELLVFTDELFHRLTVLQRLSLSAFYRYEYIAAMELSLASAKAAEEGGYPRMAAMGYSVPYAVAHGVLANPTLALYYAERITIKAREASDESALRNGLASQAIVAAESGNARRLKSIARRIITARHSKQYREDFTIGLALAIPLGWDGQFEALRAVALALREGRRPMERAQCDALLACSAYAMDDIAECRKRARSALHLTRPHTALALHDDNNRRTARGIAAAVCLRIGDRVRGERAIDTKDMTHSPEATLVRGRYAAIVAGYGRLLDVATEVHGRTGAGCASVLTRAQLRLLHELATGKSIPEIAKELDRSVTTLRSQAQAINERLEVRGRAAAIARARELGLIS